MKKILATALYSLPLAITPTVFAQTGTTAPGASTSPTTPAPAPSPMNPGAPTAPGSMAPSSPGAGMTTPRAEKPTETVSGWSVKHAILGEDVYNEQDDKIGAIQDVVLTPDGKVTSFVVEAGGFLGMGKHSVAIPFDKITKTNDKLVLAGYTKDQLKTLPEVKITE